MISASVTAAIAPHCDELLEGVPAVRRVPIASDFAIRGLDSRTWSAPSAKAVATGEQPSPAHRRSGPRAQTRRAELCELTKPLSILVSWLPDAIGPRHGREPPTELLGDLEGNVFEPSA